MDLAFSGGLSAVALFAFKDTYGGWFFLLVGIVGLLLGVTVSYLGHVWKQPFVTTALLLVVVFFLFGGAIALHGDGPSRLVPGPGTVTELADQATLGWVDLVTTMPPVDGRGPLLVLPYLLGLVAGGVGASLALTSRRVMAPVAAPVGLLVAVILLGSKQPSTVLVVGGIFASGSLWWVSLRARRTRNIVATGTTRRSRHVSSVLLVTAATGLAILVVPHLPGAETRDRFVIRSVVEPPFDIGQYPSPLSSYRLYTKSVDDERSLYNKQLFTIDGVPEGTLVRMATLDAYDGVVWGASNNRATDSIYRRVGPTLTNPATGTTVSAVVTLGEGYSGVWLPSVGALQRIEFEGPESDQHQDTFRYNLNTNSGVVTDRLGEGDQYQFTAVIPDQELPDTGDVGTDVAVLPESTKQLDRETRDWSSSTGDRISQVRAIATFLRENGGYSDGSGPGNSRFLPGHSVERLLRFTSEMTGDNEQYAATMALLASKIGAPARVVLGAEVPDGGVVTGRSVRAWVEIQLVDGSWRTLDRDEFVDVNAKPRNIPEQREQEPKGSDVPPPVPVQPPSSVGDPEATDLRSSRAGDGGAVLGLPSWLWKIVAFSLLPVLIVAVIAGLILVLKARRRHRRRTRGTPSTRAAAAWRELLDAARDHGHEIVWHQTRREQAGALVPTVGAVPLAGLAKQVDGQVFGPSDPSEAAVRQLWDDVDRARPLFADGLPWHRRWRYSLSLRSLRPAPSSEA